MKIKIKYHNQNCKIEQHGNWCDLKSAETIEFKGLLRKIYYTGDSSIIGKSENTVLLQSNNSNPIEKIEFDYKLISLGVSMKLPKYFEANIVPRSSLFLKKGILQGNSYGIIDCVPKGTIISTPEGNKLVEDIYENELRDIHSFNEEYFLVEDDIITDMWIVENKECIKIETETSTISIPLEKEVYTKRGWVKAKDLILEDEILEI